MQFPRSCQNRNFLKRKKNKDDLFLYSISSEELQRIGLEWINDESPKKDVTDIIISNEHALLLPAPLLLLLNNPICPGPLLHGSNRLYLEPSEYS